MRRAPRPTPQIDPFWAVRRPIQWNRIATKANLPQPPLYIASKRLLDIVASFVLLIAFAPFLEKKEFKIAFLIVLPAIYFYTLNFILHNTAPIADWSPYLEPGRHL